MARIILNFIYVLTSQFVGKFIDFFFLILITNYFSVKDFGIRQGQSIAVKVTLRGEVALNFLKRTLFVYDNRILKSAFDNFGNFSIGIDEHIKMPNVKYIPELGITGLNVAVRLVRPGYRVKIRRKQKTKIPKNHYVSKLESIFFVEKELGTEVVDKMEERFY